MTSFEINDDDFILDQTVVTDFILDLQTVVMTSF